MLAAVGQKLYIGAELDRVDDWSGLMKRSSELLPIDVSAPQAAGMFVPNLRTWRQQPFIAQNYAAAEIDELEHDLVGLQQSDPHSPAITFGRRRMVLQRLSH